MAYHDRLFSWISPWGLCCFSASPPCPRLRPGAVVVAVGLVGLLRPVCCRARHAARGCSRSRYARHSGCRFAPLFFRLAHCFEHSSSYCFPSRAGLRGLPIIRCLRMLAGSRPFAGAHAARTPLYITTVGLSGALPPLTPARGRPRGGVFLFRGARRRPPCPLPRVFHSCALRGRRLGGSPLVFSFVDKICLFVDFICIFMDIFVTL